MKKRYSFMLLSILALAFNALGQQLSPSVIASSGGYGASSSTSLSFTVGEMSAIETFASEGFFLTQGFQQPLQLTTSTNDGVLNGFSFGLHPNPSDGQFYILTRFEKNANIRMKISNVLGNIILQDVFLHTGNQLVKNYNLSASPPGIYFITLNVKSDSETETTFVKKLHIVQ